MAKQTFTTGQILTAAQMTSLQQTAMGGGSVTAKTASYTLVAADAGTVVQMNSASSTTITVNTALFAAGDTVQIQNVGAGVCTITAGTATVSTAGSLALSQYEGGQLYFNTTSAALFFDIVQNAGMTNPLTTTGDTIYSSSGTTPARLGIGSTGQVLTVASGLPSWATPAGGGSGMTLISTTSFSTVASQSFNSVFSATYNNYKVMITTFGSADAEMTFKFRASGTDNTSANYHYAGLGIVASSGASSTSTFGGAQTSMVIGSNNNTVQRQLMSMDVISPFSTTSTKGLTYSFIRSRTTIYGGTGYGFLDVSGTAFDGFTLTPASGNLSGTVSIYGMSI
jgi:hypothetical protein